MVLSEDEAEAQLAVLRHQREALDRTITDLTLYLELGRRLTVGPTSAEAASSAVPKPASRPATKSSFDSDRTADRTPPVLPQIRSGPFSSGSSTPPAAFPSRTTSSREPEAGTAGTSGLERAPSDGALSEGVLARRHGRALIEAALGALAEAGRPLHAGEILAVLASRGFSLPGHDPVAALNTRLWKRSGPGGPLRRMGDAVYALVDKDEA